MLIFIPGLYILWSGIFYVNDICLFEPCKHYEIPLMVMCLADFLVLPGLFFQLEQNITQNGPLEN